MDRATVLARLGPPTRSTTIEEALARYPAVVGSVPSGTEAWLYVDDLPLHGLNVVISGGVLESVEVEATDQAGAAHPPRSSGGGKDKRRIRIDKDGIFAWDPTYAILVLMAIVREVPPVDAAQLQTAYEGVRQEWHAASLTVDSGSEIYQLLHADLTQDAARPSYIAFTAIPMPDHACAQLVSLIDQPGAPFGSGMAYRVWRTVRDGQGQLAVARSQHVVGPQPGGDRSAATGTHPTPTDDQQIAHRLIELVDAHERLYELTKDKRLITEAMDHHHLDSIVSSDATPEGWISAAVELRAIGHQLNREGGKPRMQTVAERAAQLRPTGDTLRLIEVFWDRIGDWRA
jgi:hypothetical protein